MPRDTSEGAAPQGSPFAIAWPARPAGSDQISKRMAPRWSAARYSSFDW